MSIHITYIINEVYYLKKEIQMHFQNQQGSVSNYHCENWTITFTSPCPCQVERTGSISSAAFFFLFDEHPDISSSDLVVSHGNTTATSRVLFGRQIHCNCHDSDPVATVSTVLLHNPIKVNSELDGSLSWTGDGK